MHQLVNRLRNARLVSVPARHLARPIVNATDFIAGHLRKKVWINGARVTYDGIELSFPAGIGVHFASSLYWYGDNGFEPHVWRVLSAFMPTSDRFADVGSNIGLYSVLARKRAPHIDVVAFEPVPSLAVKNRAFAASNSAGDIRVYQLALSDRSCSGSVFLPKGAHLEEEQTASVDSSSWQAAHTSSIRLDVELTRFDDFCVANDWWPDLIKVDVEGHELAVLNGSATLLSQHRPVIVCEVLRDTCNSDALRSLLRANTYTAFAILEGGLFQEDTFPADRSFEYYAFLPGTGWPLYLSISSLKSMDARAFQS